MLFFIITLKPYCLIRMSNSKALKEGRWTIMMAVDSAMSMQCSRVAAAVGTRGCCPLRGSALSKDWHSSVEKGLFN